MQPIILLSMNMFKTLRLFYLINQLSSLPNDTSRVFAIADFLIRSRTPQQLHTINQKINHNPRIAQFIKTYRENTYLQLPIDYASLSRFETNSLGNALFQYYKEQNKSPAYYSNLPNDQPINIIRNYLARTHDIWHIITGFGDSSMEEYGLQAVYLGQEVSMTAFCIMCGGILECLKKGNPSLVKEYMEQITQGYQIGKDSETMLYVVWDDYFDKSIEHIRNEFNILPANQ